MTGRFDPETLWRLIDRLCNCVFFFAVAMMGVHVGFCLILGSDFSCLFLRRSW